MNPATRYPAGNDERKAADGECRVVVLQAARKGPLGAMPQGLAAGDDPHEPEGWETISTFVVEFQRRAEGGEVVHRSVAHHMESDDTASWPGIAAARVVGWLLKKSAESR